MNPQNTEQYLSVDHDAKSDLAITIMADYGMAPYAWIKPASDKTCYVGLNCGGYMNKPLQFTISDDLHDRFVVWVSNFEAECERDSFDWAMFNKVGIELAGELKKQVGPGFSVIYVKASEDPDSEVDAKTEIS